MAATELRTAPDLWDDAGPFLHRKLPARTVDQVITGETGDLRISREHGRWWIGDDNGGPGENDYPTLAAAKAAGDELMDRYEAESPAALAMDMGLVDDGIDPAGWTIEEESEAGPLLSHSALPDVRIAQDGDGIFSVYRGADDLMETFRDGDDVLIGARDPGMAMKLAGFVSPAPAPRP